MITAAGVTLDLAPTFFLFWSTFAGFRGRPRAERSPHLTPRRVVGRSAEPSAAVAQPTACYGAPRRHADIAAAESAIHGARQSSSDINAWESGGAVFG